MISNFSFLYNLPNGSYRKVLFLILLIITVDTQIIFAQNGGSLIISEILSDNESVLTDEDGEYSDWIEIQNHSAEDINIDSWYLSDDQDDLIKWLLPNHTIPSNGFLVVFASGKNRRTGELHTNFKLDDSGESVYLIRPDGKTIEDSLINYPPQQTNISYSLIDATWLFCDPTPGSQNEIGTYLNPPIFSIRHGFYEQPFLLEIQSFNGENVLYTLDGSLPEIENGILYNNPIYIDTTVVVRAVTTVSNKTSKAVTRTYIFPQTIKNQPDDPVGYPSKWGPFSTIDGYAPADYGMDPEICSNPQYKDLLVPALTSIPSISVVTDKGFLFSDSTDPETGGIYIYTNPPTGGLGKDWERPVSIEYLLPNGGQGFQIDCGIRIHGGHSRVPEKNPKHSFRLLFKEQYGPDKLKYDLFGNDATTTFNTIILRAGFNQTWLHWNTNQRNTAQYIHDSWAKGMWMKMGHPAAHNRFVHLYINGLYWGLYNLSERMDDDFMSFYLDGNKEDYDIIKDYTEVANGSIDAWNSMMNQAKEGLSDAPSYYRIQGKSEFGNDDKEIEAYLDIKNLIDYMLLNFYAGNRDWDHHNWVAARNRQKPGAGFQFFPWDSEYIFYDLRDNIVNENNDNCPSYLYNRLRTNPQFRIEFIKRANELLNPGGLLSPESAQAFWDKLSAEIELAIIAESARWGDYRRDKHLYENGPYELYTKAHQWDDAQERLKNDYFPDRSQIVLDQLNEIGLAGEIITSLPGKPDNTVLHTSYPNPFDQNITIQYFLPKPGLVEISIFSIDGKTIETCNPGELAEGIHEWIWEPKKNGNGIYYYRIITEGKSYLGKLLYTQ